MGKLLFLGGVFDTIYNNISTYIENMSKDTLGGIIFGVIMVALVSFLFAIRKSAKGKFIKNWFMFYLSITSAIIAIVLTIINNNKI